MNADEIKRRVRGLLTLESKQIHWERVGYVPHAGQMAFHMSNARFKANTCGRRWGKTVSGVRDVAPLVYIPDTYIWVVGPTKELAVKEYRLFQHDLRVLQKRGHLKIEKDVIDPVGGRYLLKVKNGATIEVKSQEKEDQMVGEGLTAVIMAEAARLKPHIWTELIRPTLGDYRGVAVFSTTPRGRNWYYDLVDAAKDHPDWAVFRNPSWTNPIVYPEGRNDPEILAQEAGSDRVTFLQEYAADFTTHAGLVYEEFDHDTHVQRFDLLPDVPVTGWVDMGFSDPFVCLLVQVTQEGRVYIHDEYYVERMTPAEHAERLKEWFDRPGSAHACPEILYCDPRSPDGIKDLKRGGWEAKAAPALDRRAHGDNPVIVGVKAVKRQLKVQEDGVPGILVHPRCKMTLQEFGRYEWVNDEPDAKKNNHACFPAGTLVATPDGDRPIEDLRTGDAVYTHLGIGRVDMGAQYTGRRNLVSVQTGNGVSCTGEHPFATADGVWLPAQDLEGACLLRRKPPKSSSTAGRSTAVIPIHRTPRTTISGHPRMTAAGRHCIRLFGRTQTARCLTVLNCITATATKAITLWRTFSWCRSTMFASTIVTTSRRRWKLQRLGMRPPRASHGIANMLSRWALVTVLCVIWSVSTADKSSRRQRYIWPASVPTPANRHGGEPRDSMTKPSNVPSAALSSSQTAMTRRKLAPTNVRVCSRPASVTVVTGLHDVYNIATSDGTYFANGFLVMNCDAIRYGILAQVARNRPSILGDDEEDEPPAVDILGRDEEYDDPYDSDESYAMQRLRERHRERERVRRAACRS